MEGNNRVNVDYDNGMSLGRVDVDDVERLKLDIYCRALDSARAINSWISSLRSRSSLKYDKKELVIFFIMSIIMSN